METDLTQSVFVEINIGFIRCYAIRHWPCAEIPKFIRCYAIRYWPWVSRFVVRCYLMFSDVLLFVIGLGCRGLLLDVAAGAEVCC